MLTTDVPKEAYWFRFNVRGEAFQSESPWRGESSPKSQAPLEIPEAHVKTIDSVRRFLDIDVEGTWIPESKEKRYFALLVDGRYYDVLMIYMSKRQKGLIAELHVSRYSTVWHSM